jgi:hypothetical protein
VQRFARVGPLTVTELAAFLCEEYYGDQEETCHFQQIQRINTDMKLWKMCEKLWH